ncbi:MAG TPA: hypothetical protein VIM73_22065 [Polyangiaceae bacterium]
MSELRSRGALGIAWVPVVVFQFGCSASASTAKDPRALVQRETEIVHEECDLSSSGAEKLDANSDRKPDVVIVREDGREVCRALDLNFDGAMDAWIYYGSDGQVRRRESDYDRDGRVDEIIVLRGGAIAEKHRATTLTGKLDTWEFYQAGALARTERDSNGDSLVDQWWEYPKAGCPVIHADVNNDGRPDPGASVDYCKETGYVPPERQDFRKTESPNFEQTGALPTEVENKEEKAPAPAPETEKKEGEK